MFILLSTLVMAGNSTIIVHDASDKETVLLESVGAVALSAAGCAQSSVKASIWVCKVQGDVARMVRADYCGDGVSHRYNGTSIDIYDHLNVVTQSADLNKVVAALAASCRAR